MPHMDPQFWSFLSHSSTYIVVAIFVVFSMLLKHQRRMALIVRGDHQASDSLQQELNALRAEVQSLRQTVALQAQSIESSRTQAVAPPPVQPVSQGEVR